MKILITLILALCALAFTQSTQPPHPQWEYKFQINTSEKKANELGAQGWELVAVSTVTNVQEYVFRRPR